MRLLEAAGHATVSLVAEIGGRAVGHVLFSPVALDPEEPGFLCAGLGPVAVLPEFQRRGVGSALILAGLKESRDFGLSGVVLLGDPAYYSRFGFERASESGFRNEYGVDAPFQFIDLSGKKSRHDALIRYGPEFAQADC